MKQRHVKPKNSSTGLNTNRRSVLSGAIAVGAAVACGDLFRGTANAADSAAERTAVVRTSNGPVRGYVERKTQVFKGLRYGAPTGGANRFLPPQKPEPWTAVFDAVDYGHGAPQGVIPGLATGRIMAQIFPDGGPQTSTSEDCLFINLWTPGVGDGRKRPVMVWLHGGGFAMGSGAAPTYDGVNLSAQGDVVVITVNHRLDVMGYTQLDHLLGSRYATSGEAGMLDIVAVLEWVRDNAAAFGGDPGNVTIFGESGGGAKVSVLLAMPKAKGLFHRAIIQSGAGVKMVERADAENLAVALLEELKIPRADARKILEIPTADLMAAAPRAIARLKSPSMGLGRTGFSPVVDGVALPRHPFDPAGPEISANVPIMIGTTATEASLFLLPDPEFGKMSWESVQKRVGMMLKDQAGPALELYRRRSPDATPTDVLVDITTDSRMGSSTVQLAERKLAQRAAPIWVYRVDWKTPVMGGILRSPHAMDLPLVFNNTAKSVPLLGNGPEPKQVADQMSATWIAFAKSGNPNNPTIPKWPAYSLDKREIMSFDVKSKVLQDPDRETRLFWAKTAGG